MRCSRNSSCHMRRYMTSHMARGEQVIWGDHQSIVQLPAQFRVALGFSISCILLQIGPANSFLLTHSFAAHFYTQITCHSFTLEVPPGRFPSHMRRPTVSHQIRPSFSNSLLSEISNGSKRKRRSSE